MNRIFIRAALTVLAIGTIALAGCAPASEAEHPTDGVWGYVTSADSAALELAADQAGATELVVDRVLAPGDAWVVVHLDDNGAPGMRVGLAGVAKGETIDLRIALEGDLTDSLIVALHADRGTPGEFDFDMESPATSPDRPYFIGGAELAAVVNVR
ncbi:MAG: hypothetical protein U1E08_06875 [Coriobacteriia bacterium]|nr:hypothetical protein [Actinomycetota bacterium]MDZ4167401.1 hypothetical protein [Coriobacteriia bacterium]